MHMKLSVTCHDKLWLAGRKNPNKSLNGKIFLMGRSGVISVIAFNDELHLFPLSAL